jgi:hypothetical protein
MFNLNRGILKMADAPPEIANLPDYPVRGEDRTSFANKANATVAAMPTAVTEMNALGAWMKSAADEVEAINLISVSNPAPASLTVTVGSGGDYATINAALAYLSQFIPAYKNTYVRATVNQLSGFVMAEQVLVSGVDFGWVSLSSVDAEVTIDHTALTIVDGAGGYPAFGVRDGGTLPKINTLYRFSAGAVPGDNKNGIYCVRGGYVDINAGKGVADAGTYGLFVNGSGEAFCDGANFSGAGTTGVYALVGSIAVVGAVDVSNAGTYGIHSGGAYVYATGADTSGAGTAGTFVEGGGVLIPLTNMTDDDTMATATATAPASGESVVAYVDAFFSETSVAADGDFTGTIYIAKVGNIVTLTWGSLTHISLVAPSSSAGLIPVGYRPSIAVTILYQHSGAAVKQCEVDPDGTFKISYRDWAGSNVSQNLSGGGSITYVAA